MSARLDSLGLWGVTMGLPEQVERAAGAPIDLGDLPGDFSGDDVRNVVVLGAGGAGTAGDVAAAVAGPLLAVPLVVVRSGDLPAWVGPGTLVLAVSYSGATAEVLAGAEAAWARGAGVVAVTGGGALLEQASANGGPSVIVPGDLVAARSAIGALSVPVLRLLEGFGLLDGTAAMLASALRQLRVRRDQLASPSNAAGAVAERIGRTFPLIHGAAGPSGVAARRLKAQVNENAKAPAFWSEHPELCHDELAGWGQHGDVTRQIITLVALRCPGEPALLARRFDLVTDILREVVADVVEVHAEGDGPLAQLFDLVLFGDVVSLCMAAEAGVDPGPRPMVEETEALLRP